MAMTAEFLVTEIFSRPQQGAPADMRRLTERQFVALRALMLEEESKGTVHGGLGGSLVWMPPGQVKYVLTEDRARWKHTLTRMSTATPAESGRLF
jgi:hypothetical protein